MNNKTKDDLSSLTSNNKNLYVNNINIDARITIALKHLNLLHLTKIFKDNKITFVDLLFLEYEDYALFSINENDTKRLFSFSKKYLSFGEDYTSEEVILFFNKHKEFEFQKKKKGKMGYSKDLIVKKGDFKIMNGHHKKTWNYKTALIEKMEMSFICEKPSHSQEYIFT
jgi:hypothetical protein